MAEGFTVRREFQMRAQQLRIGDWQVDPTWLAISGWAHRESCVPACYVAVTPQYDSPRYLSVLAEAASYIAQPGEARLPLLGFVRVPRLRDGRALVYQLPLGLEHPPDLR